MKASTESAQSGNGNSYTRGYGSVHTFYISGAITEPENYIEMIDAIRNATNSDIVQIIINSGGGALVTGMQIRQAIMNCDAHVQTIAEGMCASAATMIFLAGDEMISDPHTMFMFHNYSGGTFGKGGEMHEQITFERRWSMDFMHDVYKNFLTKSEIISMMDGKDYWFTGKEVVARLQALNEKKEKKEKKTKQKKVEGQ